MGSYASKLALAVALITAAKVIIMTATNTLVNPNFLFRLIIYIPA